MPDNLSHDPSLFGTIGQSLSDEAGLFLGDPLLDLLPSLHEGVGGSHFAVDINADGLRVQETGLEAWMRGLREQREQQLEELRNQSSGLDPLTGYTPTVSSGTTPIVEPSSGIETASGVVDPLAANSDSAASANAESAGTTLDPLVPDVIRLEAEGMSYSSGYEVRNHPFASGEQFLNLNPRERHGGSAQSTFNGPSGTYAVIVGYYDEADGEGRMSLDVGDEHIEWTLNEQRKGRRAGRRTFVRRVVSQGMTLKPGDELTLNGYRDRGELAAIDYIELVPIDPNVTLPFRVEAEDVSLETYKVSKNQEYASGNGLVRLTSPSGTTGHARFAFPKESGRYDVVVGYYDESDGNAQYALRLGDTDYQWHGNEDFGSRHTGADTLVRRTILEGASLSQNDLIELLGTRDKGDRAAIDYIEFIPTATDNATAGPGISVVPVDGGVTPPPIPSAPVTLDSTIDATDIQSFKANSTKLWSLEGRGGGTTTYEFGLGSSGAQNELFQQGEHIWENGVDVPWSLEWQGNQVVFTIAGQTMNYPTGEASELTGLSLLTKVNTTSATKVSTGTTMHLSVTDANGSALATPISLNSTGPDNAQDLDELFIRSDGQLGTVSGVARLSWPDDGVNPHQSNSQSRVTFVLSGYELGAITPPPPPAPVITAGLASDTGLSATDGITNSSTITGQIATDTPIVSLKAALNDATPAALVDIQAQLQADGTFTLDPTQLTSLNGGTLADGDYTLYLQAETSDGQVSAPAIVPFTLDTTAPELSLDSPIDSAAHSPTVRLTGTATDGGGAITLDSTLDGTATGAISTDSTGTFDQSLGNNLATGSHSISINVTDVAGNQTTTTKTFEVSDDILIAPGQSDGWGIRTEDGLILAERGSTLSQAVIPVELGQAEGSRVLRFELETLLDTTDPSALLEDQLLVYLTDSPTSTQMTLLDAGQSGTALFSIAGDAVDFVPGLVSYDGSAIEIDVTSLAEDADGQGYLVFQLLNQDTDTGTRIQVSNLTNTVDSEGSERPIFPITSSPVRAGNSSNSKFKL